MSVNFRLELRSSAQNVQIDWLVCKTGSGAKKLKSSAAIHGGWH